MSATPGPCGLGVDLGTSGARAVVIDSEGAVVGRGAADYSGADLRDGVIHEQLPRAWWDAVTAAITAAVARCDHRSIAAVAIDSTSGTILVRNPDGSADGAALMYDDDRAGDLLARVHATGHDYWASAGGLPQRSWGLLKAMWLVEHAMVGPGQQIVHQADYIASRLAGGPVATDTSHALKTGVDVRTASWPGAVFDALGLTTEALPPIVLPGTVIGEVSLRAANEIGLAAGTPIRAGMTDGCAAQIAAAALAAGSWTSALGTTLTIKGSTAERLLDPCGVIYNHRHPDGGWLPGGASSVGAGAVAVQFPDADLVRLTAAAAAFDPAPGVTYPLVGVGERFPFTAAHARGFSTIDTDAAPARLAAILQGIAYLERLSYERVADLDADIKGPIVFTGATTANHYWNQLRCDILGRAVVVPESADAARGMAILALAEPGTLSATASRLTRIAARYQPDEQRAQRHLGNYQELCDQLVQRGWLRRPVVSPGPVHA